MEDQPPDSHETPVPPPSWETPPPPPVPGPGVIPWEEPGRPWLSRLTDTVRLLFSGPRAAFDRMPLDSDLLKPFVFAILVGTLGTVFSMLYESLFRGLIRGMMPNATEYGRYQIPIVFVPFIAMFSPALVAVGVVIAAAINHVFLLLVGGAKRGFGATLRTVCYAEAAQVLQLLPGCGSLLTLVAWIVFMVVGLSSAHRISNGRAAVAIILPLILCCVCIAICVFTLGAAYFSHFGSGMSKP